MVHSVIQQVIRQDPEYYMLSAAARPDANYRLMSYPYYVADKKVGESAFFRHVDLHLDDILKPLAPKAPSVPQIAPTHQQPALDGGLTIQGGVAIYDETT